MNWKEFFKPTIGKIIILLILMIGLNYFIISISGVLDGGILAGIPLGFWPIESYYIKDIGLIPSLSFSWINFILDIIFWYLISCLIVFTYNKIRKR